MSQITIIKKNDEFQSFDECFMKVELHCKESFVNFYIHDSHRFGIKDEKKEPPIYSTFTIQTPSSSQLVEEDFIPSAQF